MMRLTFNICAAMVVLAFAFSMLSSNRVTVLDLVLAAAIVIIFGYMAFPKDQK